MDINHSESIGVKSILQSTRWWIFHCHLIFQSRQNTEEKKLILLMVQKSGDHQVEVGSLSHYLQVCFSSKRWFFGISSINRIFHYNLTKRHQTNPLYVDQRFEPRFVQLLKATSKFSIWNFYSLLLMVTCGQIWYMLIKYDHCMYTPWN